MTIVCYELLEHGEKMTDILHVYSWKVDQQMNFHKKGSIEVGEDADILILDKKKRIEHVMAMGKWNVKHKQQMLKGTFE